MANGTARSFIFESIVRCYHITIWTPVSMKTRGNILTIQNKTYTYIHNIFMFVRTRRCGIVNLTNELQFYSLCKFIPVNQLIVIS